MNAPPNDFDKAYWGEEGIDISRWKGGECARGVRYIETGAPVKSGTAGQVRKMSSQLTLNLESLSLQREVKRI
jgi:hypothetical protein